MNSRTSWQATLGRTPAGAQHGRSVHSTESRLVGEHNSQGPASGRGGAPSLLHRLAKPFFYRLLVPSHLAQDETDAASTCATDGGPRDCRSYSPLSYARVAPRGEF